MQNQSTVAILLRRIAYGDYDLIVTLLTDRFGKLAAMAKYAKKSTKRFAGILEPFAVLDIVFSPGRAKGLYLLKEASLVKPFARIRTDILATAYASYWTELVESWTESGHPQNGLYQLLAFALDRLDEGGIPAAVLSALFQIRFLDLAGLSPELERCSKCHCSVKNIGTSKLAVDPGAGGIVCSGCGRNKDLHLTRGTVKQLQWLASGDLRQALRVKISGPSLEEATGFLEEFVPYHLGKNPKSLKVLHQLRAGKGQ